ncbi:MAG: bifunctional ADP-dependent NAD(P)H-hydrate dehydratase/NAD(P)H-hydrate epimerase [Bacteroidetes bacterium QS_3_64_15]|nr:MAG: bifunctional ADP-dependent NAD(P)H-hydrate dehydratase/NAD(P)H-hydrate epimerase [Bacteroidetes bacterium QS_3_64_15]
MALSLPNEQCPPALTADAMREADRYTIEEYGLSSITLMEVAGRGCAEHIQAAYGPLDGEVVVIFCGKGNNGGDGLVVARHLLANGAQVHVVLTSAPGDLSEDAAHNLSLLQQLKDEAAGGTRLTIEGLGDLDALMDTISARHPCLYVDALLGTGLTSDVREPARSLVERMNGRDVPTVAIDMPTGLHSDTGAVLGVAVQADRTVTMAAPKVGVRIGEGPVHAGSVSVVDIGIPPFVLDRVAGQPGCVRETTDAAVRAWWPERSHDAYKYSVGTALVVGGAPQFTGAPVMAAKAAGRSGAGYVSCACPETVQPTLSGVLTTIPTHPLPTGDDGGIAPDAALDALTDILDKADALLVGPGLGRAPQTEQFVRRLVRETDAPLVLDADGLNALAGRIDELAEQRDAPWLLTPHAGEFRRLAGGDVTLTDRVRVVQEYANRWGAVCLLKGAPSIVAGPEGRAFAGSIIPPALATAGTGDVLAGQCVGLLAQGVPPLEAAAAALHVGGAAAERYGATHDSRSMVATDLLDMIPRVAAERFA